MACTLATKASRAVPLHFLCGFPDYITAQSIQSYDRISDGTVVDDLFARGSREKRCNAAEFDLHWTVLINIPRTLRPPCASSFPLCLFDLLPHSFWVHSNNLLEDERQIQRAMHSKQRDIVAWLMIEVRVREKGHSDRSSEAEMGFLVQKTPLLLHEMCLKPGNPVDDNTLTLMFFIAFHPFLI